MHPMLLYFYLYYCDLAEELGESGSLICKTLSTLSPERYPPKVQCGQYLIYESVVASVLQIFYYSTLTESRWRSWLLHRTTICPQNAFGIFIQNFQRDSVCNDFMKRILALHLDVRNLNCESTGTVCLYGEI